MKDLQVTSEAGNFICEQMWWHYCLFVITVSKQYISTLRLEESPVCFFQKYNFMTVLGGC